MDSMGGVKVSAHYCGPPVPDPDARPRGAGGVGEYADAAAEKAAAARVAEVVASNARLVGATCPHLESVRALQPELPRLQPYMYAAQAATLCGNLMYLRRRFTATAACTRAHPTTTTYST